MRVFVLLVVTLLGGVSFARADKPNVLFIAIDDLNDWVGCLQGHPQATTPNIDALAARGTLFTNAHCQGPICGPSRASLLSGKYPHTTGIYQQPKGKLMEEDREHFRGKLLPEYFARHGYRTLASGKITHGYSAKRAFDAYGGGFGGSGPKPERRFNYHLPDGPFTGTQTDWGSFPDRNEKMPDHKTVQWAIRQLESDHSQPWFLATGIVRPHVPFYVPDEWFAPFPVGQVLLPDVRRDDLDDVPPIGRLIHEMPKYPDLNFLQAFEETQFRLCVQAYLACIRFVDHQVGKLVKTLDSSPFADNTVIVLFSDHGYHLGEKNRVSKHSLWEESTRVPLVIVAPKGRPGQTCESPVGLIDLYPTLLELCGLPARAENEGASLVPLLRDPDRSVRHSILTTYAKGNHALRGPRFRYIRYQDGSEELYDHDADPNEWANLAGSSEFRDVILDFRNRLPKHESNYHSATHAGAVNAWFQEHLRANGITE